MISPIGKMIEPTKAYLEIHSMKRLASPPDEILVNCRVPLHNMIAHINLELTYFHMYFVAITVSWVTGTDQSDRQTQGMRPLYTTYHLYLLRS